MDNNTFKFVVQECFKLSTGATAFVGLIEPFDFPLITTDNYIIELRTCLGKKYMFNKISEDIFVRSDPKLHNKFRSLQTFENVEDFISNVNIDPIILVGVKREK